MIEKPIRIMLVDDHPIVRSGLLLMIEYTPNMEVVAEASNGIEAIKLYQQNHPDVTLMDLRMPEMSGADAIAAIHQEFPDAKIIVLTTYDGDEDIYRGLKAGAKGYIFKNAPVDEIVRAIKTVNEGKKYSNYSTYSKQGFDGVQSDENGLKSRKSLSSSSIDNGTNNRK